MNRKEIQRDTEINNSVQCNITYVCEAAVHPNKKDFTNIKLSN